MKKCIIVYAGQYYDQETGLHYNYHRYYDPKLGRYLTPDPIGLAGGINLFSYVSNNPINSFDPFGLTEATSINNCCGDAESRCREACSSLGGMKLCHTYSDANGPVASLCRCNTDTDDECADKHHPIPKFLGGETKQLFSKLKPSIHKELHSLLGQNLKEAGFNLPVGGSKGSALKWADYLIKNRGEQQRTFDIVMKTSKQIDDKYGTDVVNKLRRNLYKCRYRRF